MWTVAATLLINKEPINDKATQRVRVVRGFKIVELIFLQVWLFFSLFTRELLNPLNLCFIQGSMTSITKEILNPNYFTHRS